jgi:hypothetical protein
LFPARAYRVVVLGSGVPGSDLDAPERHTGIEGGGDEL